MADATQGDAYVQYLGLLVLALIALIAGLLIHSFIIGVNVSDWWEGRSVTAVDHIVTSLGILRMCCQFADTLYLYVATFCMKIPAMTIPMVIIGSIYDLFNYANIWLTSLLSIVLCLKISNFHSRLFLYLRGMIIHRTGSLIVASLLFSALNSLINLSPLVIEMVKYGPYNTNNYNLFIGTYNTTMYNLTSSCPYVNTFYAYTIGTFFPLLFYCISSVLLFSSLYHHTTRMKMSSNLSISLETYYSAMKLVSFTFIYNTIYFFGRFACVFHYYLYCVNLAWLYIVLEFIPVLHSSYLIYRTAKLKNHMCKDLQNVINFFSKGKDTETGENIEVKE